MRSPKLPHISLALLCLAGSVPVQAQLVASDDFEGYAIGSELAGQNGGLGWGGDWAVSGRADDVTLVAATLSYANGVVDSDGGTRSLQVSFDPEEGSGITNGILSRSLAAAQSGTVYMSFLFQDSTNPDLGNDFIQLGFSAGTANPEASVMRRSGSYQARSTTDPNNSANSGIAAGVGVTRMLVLKAEKTGGGNYDKVSLFVDPDSGDEPAAASAVAEVDSGLSTLPNLLARSAFHELGDTFLVDNIRIAATWEDAVAPAPPAPFIITEIRFDGSEVILTWNSKRRHEYAVFASDDLVTWWEVVDSQVAEDTTRSYTVTGVDAISPNGIRHFRIEDRGRVPDPP